VTSRPVQVAEVPFEQDDAEPPRARRVLQAADAFGKTKSGRISRRSLAESPNTNVSWGGCPTRYTAVEAARVR
jgi:hypothetical protein